MGKRNKDGSLLDAELAGFLNTNNYDAMDGGFEDGEDDDVAKSKPLADLYPECTILFADIVGFVSDNLRTPIAPLRFLPPSLNVVLLSDRRLGVRQETQPVYSR